MKTSVLLAISDPNVGIVLGEYLRLRDFDVDFRDSASEAFNSAAKNRYDFCVLGLDDKQALLQLTADIRHACDTPIFCLLNSPPKVGGVPEGGGSMNNLQTYHAERSYPLWVKKLLTLNSSDYILSLYSAGADDCLVQPVFPDILICKMQAMLKRWNEFQRRLPQVFDFPNVHFDSITQTLVIHPSPESRNICLPPSSYLLHSSTIHLSTKENGVLLLLCRNENQLVERSRILKEVWQSDSYFNARSLSVYINRLRHYLEPLSPLRIISMRTRGYKLLVP